MKIPVLKLMLLSAVLAQATTAYSQSLPKFGVGAKVSTLGFGIEAATAVTKKSNVRGVVNFLNYDHSFSESGINYGASLNFRSVEAHYDLFFGAFRFSPGLMVYNGNKVEGTATVPGGRSFTLGSRTYFSSATDPVIGTSGIDFGKRKVAPMLTAGVGNLLRRTGRRFSITVDGGIVFEGSPRATLNLGGSTCVAAGGPCQTIASNSQVQSDIHAEEAKINSGASPYDSAVKVLKYYPVISVGFGLRLK